MKFNFISEPNQIFVMEDDYGDGDIEWKTDELRDKNNELINL